MRILVAPDKFKGSLGARAVAENIGAGFRKSRPDSRIDIVPMADGGEGTAEVICDALHGSWTTCQAHDALGRAIECRYAQIESDKLAVMEMSEAAGMRRVRGDEVDLPSATTFGVGEMLLHAMQSGVNRIIIGLGGSATNDGGFGMARALGFRFLAGPEPDRELTGKVTELQGLTRIETIAAVFMSAADETRRLKHRSPQIVAAVDVKNPLVGENGATHIFARQKGATPDQIEALEHALTRLADVVARDLKHDFRDRAGAGAAGGLGFGLLSFCGASVRSGFEIVAESIGLESKIREADIIITGEGKLDRQTMEGKVPSGVARLARKYGKRIFAIVGQWSEDHEVQSLFEKVLPLSGEGISEATSMKRTAELLRDRAEELATIL